MPINARGQYRGDDHRDRFYAAIRGGKWTVEPVAGNELVCNIYDHQRLKVGQITFKQKTKTRFEFVAGVFYNKPVVSGKVLNSSQAIAEFEAIIRSMHVVPDR